MPFDSIVFSVYNNDRLLDSYTTYDLAKERYSQELTNYIHTDYTLIHDHLPSYEECCEVREMAVVVGIRREKL